MVDITRAGFQPNVNMKEPTVYYFGCSTQSGHYLWQSEWSQAGYRVPAFNDVLMRSFDGAFVPPTHEEGKYQVSQVGPWTILSWPDYRVDTRPGSHSTFIIGPDSDEDDAWYWTRKKFPSVFKRLDTTPLSPFFPQINPM